MAHVRIAAAPAALRTIDAANGCLLDPKAASWPESVAVSFRHPDHLEFRTNFPAIVRSFIKKFALLHCERFVRAGLFEAHPIRFQSPLLRDRDLARMMLPETSN